MQQEPVDKERELWNSVAELGEGVRYQYRSWMFDLLAAILAYYKYRGTEPKDMLSPELLGRIDWLLRDK